MQNCDTYKETKIIEFDNMVVHVHFPDISEEENRRRLQGIYKAAVDLLKSCPPK